MFEEMAVLVDAQGEMLDAIEACSLVCWLGVPRLELKSLCKGSCEQHEGVHCASGAGPASKSSSPKARIDIQSLLGVDQDPESTDAGTGGHWALNGKLKHQTKEATKGFNCRRVVSEDFTLRTAGSAGIGLDCAGSVYQQHDPTYGC